MTQNFWYTFRNFLCVLLISIMLTQSSIQVLPTFGAPDRTQVDIVALLVDEDVLTDSGLKSRIETYGDFIRRSKNHTKVIIVPVSPDESTWNVTKVLEKLYFEGDNTPNEQNKLTGVVIIGEVPLPVVYNQETTFVSIYPYVDFADKLYIYDGVMDRFVKNSYVSTAEPEIWHGVINPPVEKGGEYYTLLADYFDKNIKYRLGDEDFGVFDHKIFYTDLPKELRTISDYDIEAYEIFKKYWEDIAYLRFNKHLFEKIMEEMGNAVEPAAWDNLDNDGDGRVDEDPIDGRDNDGDGENCSPMEREPVLGNFIYEPCTSDPSAPDRARYAWADGIDNDQDGIIDEGIDEDDGEPFVNIDNDFDGQIDEDGFQDNDADGDGMPDEDPPGDKNNDGFPKDKASFLKYVENLPFPPNPVAYVYQNDDLDRLVDEDGLEDNDADGDGKRDEDPSFTLGNTLPPTATMPDVLTGPSILQYLRSFDEGFSDYFNQVSESVQGTGRWQTQDVDTLFTLLAKKDEGTIFTIKKANDNFEMITNNYYVQSNAKNFPVITSIPEVGGSILYGVPASSISAAEQCTWYYGSAPTVDHNAVMVEADRSNNTQNSPDTCDDLPYYGCCAQKMNVDENNGKLYKNNQCRYKKAILPVNDLLGTRELEASELDEAEYKNSYLYCFAANVPDKLSTKDDPYCTQMNTYLELVAQGASTKPVDSIVYHVEPTSETYCLHSGGEVKNGECVVSEEDIRQLPVAMPTDDPRYVDFYMPGPPQGPQMCDSGLLTRGELGYVRIDYFNLFDLEFSGKTRSDAAAAVEEALRIFDGDVQEYILKYRDPQGDFPTEGPMYNALMAMSESDRNKIYDALLWKKMSLQEKYELIFESYISPVQYTEGDEPDRGSNTNPAIYDDILPRKPYNGYEVFYFVAQGDTHDKLPLNFTLEPIDSDFENINLEKELPIPQDATFCDGEFNKYAEEILRWPDAVTCWLEGLNKPIVSFPNDDEATKEVLDEFRQPGDKESQRFTPPPDQDKDGLYDDIDDNKTDPDVNRNGMLDGQDALASIDIEASSQLLLHEEGDVQTLTAKLYDAQGNYLSTNTRDRIRFYTVPAEQEHVKLSNTDPQTAIHGKSEIAMYPGKEPGQVSVIAEVEQNFVTNNFSPLFTTEELQNPFVEVRLENDAGEKISSVPMNSDETITAVATLYDPDSPVDAKRPWENSDTNITILLVAKDPAYPNRNLDSLDLSSITPEGGEEPELVCMDIPGEQSYCGYEFTVSSTEGELRVPFSIGNDAGFIKAIAYPEDQSDKTERRWGKRHHSTAVLGIENKRVIRSEPFPIYTIREKIDLQTMSIIDGNALANDVMSVGTDDAIIITATLTDQDQGDYSNLSGIPIRFVIEQNAEIGSFIINESRDRVITTIEATIQNGRAQAVVRPTTLQGSFDVTTEVLTSDVQFYPTTTTITTVADTIEYMRMDVASSYLVQGKTTVTPELSFIDPFENVIDFPDRTVTVDIQGPIQIIPELVDFNPEFEGLQVPAPELQDIEITTIPEAVGDASLTVRFSPSLFVTQNFTVIPEGTIDLVIDEDTHPANGQSTTMLTATLKTPEGDLVESSQELVSFQVTDPSIGIVREVNVPVVNGVAQTELRAGITAGETTVRATSYGFRDAEVALTTYPGPPAKIQFHLEQDKLLSGSEQIEIGLYDEFGNLLTNHTGTQIQLEVSEQTQPNGSLSPAVVPIQNGVGTFTVYPERRGTINILASSGDLQRDKLTVLTQLTLDKEYIKDLAPQTLYANMFGMPFGNPSLTDNLGSWWLFSGKTQAVTTMTAPIEEPTVITKVEPNGNIFLNNASGGNYGRDIRFIQLADNTPGFEIFDPEFNSSLLKFFYHLNDAEVVVVNDDTQLAFDRNRFYVEHLRDDISELFYEEGVAILHAQDRDLAAIKPDGTIEIIDNLLIAEASYVEGMPISVNLNLGPTTLATVTFAFDTLEVIEAGESSGNSTGYIEVERTSSLVQHQLKPYYFGSSTNNPTSLALVDTQETQEIHSHPFTSVEDILSESETAIGFRSDLKHIARFGAGEPVGPATKQYASEILINLGDPMLTLSHGSLLKKNNLAFDTMPLSVEGEAYEMITSVKPGGAMYEAGVRVSDVLKSINGSRISFTRGSTQILNTVANNVTEIDMVLVRNGSDMQVTVELNNFTQDLGEVMFNDQGTFPTQMNKIDFDGDGDQDLLMAQSNNMIRLLENAQGFSPLTDMGAVQYIPDGIDDLTIGDFTGDGKQDFMIPSKDNRFGLFETNGEQFTREDIDFETNGDIYLSKAADFNGDGITDIVTADNFGEVRSFPGGQGRLGTNSTLIESIPFTTAHPAFDNAELNMGVMVHYDEGPQNNGILRPWVEDKFLKIPYQEVGGDLDPDNPNEENEFAGGLQSLTEEFKAYDVQMEEFGGTVTPIEFMDASIASTGFITIQKTVQSPRQRIKDNDILTFSITMNNTGGKDGNVKILDSREGLFEINRESITCENCGDYILVENSPSDRYDLFVDKITIPANEQAVLSYKAKVLEYPELEVHVGNLGNTVSSAAWNPMDAVKQQGVAYAQQAQQVIINDPSNPKPATPIEPPQSLIDVIEGGTDGQNDAESLTDLMDILVNDEDGDCLPNSVDPYPGVTNVAGLPAFSDISKNVGGIGRAIQCGTTVGAATINQVGNSLTEFANSVDQVAFNVSQSIEGSLCGKGSSCISLPLNYAFLVPGEGQLPVPSFTLPVFAAPTTWYPFGVPTPGIWPPFWDGTTGNAPFESQVRFYISPTLTGSVATAVCLGPHGVGMTQLPSLGPVAPNANCFVFVLDELIDAAGLRDFCNNLKQNIEQAVNAGTNLVTDASFGLVRFNATGGSRFPQISQKRNIRPPSFPSLLTEWADRQIDEIFNKLTKLPNIYIILPDFKRALGPTVEPTFVNRVANVAAKHTAGEGDSIDTGAELTASLDEFFAYIGSIPMIDLELRPVIIEIPWLDPNELRRIRDNLEAILWDSLLEFSKFQAIFACTLPDTFLPGDDEEEEVADNKVGQQATDLITQLTDIAGKKGAELVENDPGYKATQEKVKAWNEEYKKLRAAAEPDMDTDRMIDEMWKMQEKRNAARKIIESDTATPAQKDAARSEFDQETVNLKRKKKEWRNAEQNLTICSIDPNIRLLNVNYQQFISSVGENLRAVDAWVKFPLELKKYLQWKTKYLGQLTGYLDTIVGSTVGYIQDNKIIVKRWIQTIESVRNALGTFQAILDLFLDYKAQCATCRNDRSNGMNMLVDLISGFLPEPPIFKFKKWPDIILDVSQIEPIDVIIPDIKFIPRPVTFPSLRGIKINFDALLAGLNLQFGLDGSIGLNMGSIDIPELPVLPRPPELWELPELPPLPKIELPNLPPAPKIPNISGGITATIKLGGSILNIFCLLTNNKVPIPEWQLRRHIEDLTERTGFFSLDFLKLSWPSVPMPYVDKIRVKTFTDFQITTEPVYDFVNGVAEQFNQTVTRNLVDGTNDIIKQVVDITNDNIALVEGSINQSLANPVAAINALAEAFAPVERDPNIPYGTDAGVNNAGQQETYLTFPNEVSTKYTIDPDQDITISVVDNPQGYRITNLNGITVCLFTFNNSKEAVALAPFEECLDRYDVSLSSATQSMTIKVIQDQEDAQYRINGNELFILSPGDAEETRYVMNLDENIIMSTDYLNNQNLLVAQDGNREHALLIYYNDDRTLITQTLRTERDLRVPFNVFRTNDGFTISAREEVHPYSYILDGNTIRSFSETDNAVGDIITDLPRTIEIARNFEDGRNYMSLGIEDQEDIIFFDVTPEQTIIFDAPEFARDLRVTYDVSLLNGILTVTPREEIQSNWYVLNSEKTQLSVTFLGSDNTQNYNLTIPDELTVEKHFSDGVSHLQLSNAEGDRLYFGFDGTGAFVTWSPEENPLEGYVATQIGNTIVVAEEIETVSELPSTLPEAFINNTKQTFALLELTTKQEVSVEELQRGFAGELEKLQASSLARSKEFKAVEEALRIAATPDMTPPITREEIINDPGMQSFIAQIDNLEEHQKDTETLIANMNVEDFFSEDNNRLLAEMGVITESPEYMLASDMDTTVPPKLISQESVSSSVYTTSFTEGTRLAQLTPEGLAAQYEQEAEDARNADPSDIELENNAEGVYLYDMERGEGVKLLDYSDEDDDQMQYFLSDIDNDGDLDVLYSFLGTIYLKRNWQNAARITPYNGPVSVVSFASLLPSYGAPLMPRMTGVDSRNVSMKWYRNPEINTYGYQVTMYSTPKGFMYERFPDMNPDITKIEKYYVFEESTKSALIQEYGVSVGDVDIIPDEDEVTTNFGLPNGMYFAKVRAFGPRGFGNYSEMLLLPPQSHADSTPPSVTIKDGTEQELVLFGTMTLDGSQARDEHEIVRYSWDLDDEVDENDDGNFINDDEFSEEVITIGPYEKETTKVITLSVTDEFHNTTEVPIIIHIRAPEVIIDSIDAETGVLTGHIEPRLPDYYVNIARDRNGAIDLLQPGTTSTSYVTDDNGEFTVEPLYFDGSIEVRRTGSDGTESLVAEVYPETGGVTLRSDDVRLWARATSETAPVRIEIVDQADTVLSTIAFTSSGDTPPQIVEFFSDSVRDEPGVQAVDSNVTDIYSLELIPMEAPSFGGGMALIDTQDATTLAIISPRGAVHIFDDALRMETEPVLGPGSPVIFTLHNDVSELIRLHIGS